MAQQVLEDVKEDGTAYPRFQPKPTLAPVRPTGQATPMLGTPQTQAPLAPLQPIQERGQSAPGMTPAVTPQASRNPALPPKTPTLPEDQQTPGSSGPTGGQPPSQPMIPPPPPPVGTMPGGPMVNPQAPGTGNTGIVPPTTGGPMVQPPAPGSTGTPTSPATTGDTAAIAPIVAGGTNDLRYQTITGNDPRLGQTQTQVDTARDTLSSTPDRTELAAQALQLLRERTAPQYAADQRAIGQSAAKFGRIGAGMTTNELTDLNLTRERDLDRTSRELANTAAGQTMSDRLARLGALGGLESQQFGQGQAGRDELRGERSYQNQTDQQARDDERQRLLLEDQLLNSQFGREQSRASLLGQLGFGQDPTGALMGQGGYYGDMANQSGAGASDLLQLWAQQQAAGGAPAATAPAPTVRRVNDGGLG